jgi:hypothetical protein
MQQTREELIEAAMLAKMVGSHMAGIDQMTVEKRNSPANKINMQQFVAPLLGKQVNNQSDGMFVDPKMQKAVRDAEIMALQQVPDPTDNSSALPIAEPLPVQNTSFPIPPLHPVPQLPIQQVASHISNEDMEIIKDQLEKINTNLTKMTGMFGKIFANLTSNKK